MPGVFEFLRILFSSRISPKHTVQLLNHIDNIAISFGGTMHYDVVQCASNSDNDATSGSG